MSLDGVEPKSRRMPALFSMDRKRPAAVQVYDDLRERIVALELEPGSSLSRVSMIEHYGVSQTPVRDALMLLEKEGLVEVYPQSKTLISRIDVEHSRETQFLRTAFEIEVARLLAARSDKSGLAEPRALLQAQDAVLRDGGPLERFRDLDYRFHAALSEAAGQANLWNLIVSRSGHIDRLRNLHLPDAGKANKVLADHAQMFEAIERSDAEAAGAAVRLHLSGTLSALPTIMRKHPTYF